jgi:hypothetical protein
MSISAQDAVFLVRLAGCCRNKGAAEPEKSVEPVESVEPEKKVAGTQESDVTFLARLGCCRKGG